MEGLSNWCYILYCQDPHLFHQRLTALRAVVLNDLPDEREREESGIENWRSDT